MEIIPFISNDRSVLATLKFCILNSQKLDNLAKKGSIKNYTFSLHNILFLVGFIVAFLHYISNLTVEEIQHMVNVKNSIKRSPQKRRLFKTAETIFSETIKSNSKTEKPICPKPRGYALTKSEPCLRPCLSVTGKPELSSRDEDAECKAAFSAEFEANGSVNVDPLRYKVNHDQTKKSQDTPVWNDNGIHSFKGSSTPISNVAIETLGFVDTKNVLRGLEPLNIELPMLDQLAKDKLKPEFKSSNSVIANPKLTNVNNTNEKEKYKEETTKSLATTVAYKAIGDETTKLNENQNLS